METPTLTYIVLSFLAVSTQAASLNEIGKVSPICDRARRNFWFSRVSPSCCNDQGLCFKWINPNETKYELTNDEKDIIRECTCDKILYDCITNRMNGMTESEVEEIRNYIFGQLSCFQKTVTFEKGARPVAKYKMYNFLSIAATSLNHGSSS